MAKYLSKSRRPSGYAALCALAGGQLVSTVGTRMTEFAVAVWVWSRTGSATHLAALSMVAYGSTIILSFFVGGLIDKGNRKVMAALSDVGSLVVTAAVLLIFATGHQQLWHLYAFNALTGAFLAFKGPSYSALITILVERGQYTRANALIGLARSVSLAFAPAAAGAVLHFASLSTILLVDTLSYVIAILVVVVVLIPQREAARSEQPGDSLGFWRNTTTGFRYIMARPPLMGLLAVIFGVSLIAAMSWVLFPPMVLGRTGNNAGELGLVQTVGALGGVAGGLVLMRHKAPGHKVLRILAGVLVLSVPGRIFFGFDSVVAWAVGLFLGWGAIPFIEGYNSSIWQEKVPPALQGRVFAVQQLVETLALPIGFLAAGPLADHVFEPAMQPQGWLAPVFGPFTGTGAGAGIAVIYVGTGILGVLGAMVAFVTPAVRHAETRLADWSEQDEPAAASDAEPDAQVEALRADMDALREEFDMDYAAPSVSVGHAPDEDENRR